MDERKKWMKEEIGKSKGENKCPLLMELPPTPDKRLNSGGNDGY